MSNFDTAIITVLKREGGFVDNPHDSGGATNFGISLRFLKSIDSNATIEDIKNLTTENASNLYKLHWWDKYQYERIINQSIATKVFDAAVNMGSHWSHIGLQRSVLAASGISLKEDGILGDKSIAEINNVNPTELLVAYRSELAGIYRSFNEREFIDGWLARAYDI